MTTKHQDPLFLQEGASKAVALLRAIGNEHRLLVLCLLIEHGEMTVGTLNEYVALSQSALSQHLAKMREEGLVAYRREAQSVHYRIQNPNVAKIVTTLKEIFCP
jgi:DNA-binding transcriptional ArsR family regulator